MDELRRLATGRFGDMVKAVVDLQRHIMLLDADLHADHEAQLLVEGSARPVGHQLVSRPAGERLARVRFHD